MFREFTWKSSFPHKLGVVLISGALAGCGTDTSFQKANDKVSMVSVGDPGEISASSLAKAMIKAGFTYDEILELGPGIRRGLSEGGGAQASRNGEIVALFSHKGGRLYVASGTSGTFVTEM